MCVGGMIQLRLLLALPLPYPTPAPIPAELLISFNFICTANVTFIVFGFGLWFYLAFSLVKFIAANACEGLSWCHKFDLCRII